MQYGKLMSEVPKWTSATHHSIEEYVVSGNITLWDERKTLHESADDIASLPSNMIYISQTSPHP
jgi:hypothetical protein